MQPQRLEKEALVTETKVTLAKFGDYLLTTESSLESLKQSGLEDILRILGSSGRLKTKESKQFFNSHRKRFDRDLSRFLRYSAITTIYTLFEYKAQSFMDDFDRTYPGKPLFDDIQKKHRVGFVKNFREWLKLPPTPVELDPPRIWKILDDFRVIRNCIVHSNGDLKHVKYKQTIEKIVGATRKVHFDSSGILVFERDFAFEVLHKIDVFFSLLFKASGYGLKLPANYANQFAENIAGFESEIAKSIKEYYAKQTINLGGSL